MKNKYDKYFVIGFILIFFNLLCQFLNYNKCLEVKKSGYYTYCEFLGTSDVFYFFGYNCFTIAGIIFIVIYFKKKKKDKLKNSNNIKTFEEYLDNNFKSTGIRTNMQSIRVTNNKNMSLDKTDNLIIMKETYNKFKKDSQNKKESLKAMKETYEQAKHNLSKGIKLDELEELYANEYINKEDYEETKNAIECLQVIVDTYPDLIKDFEKSNANIKNENEYEYEEETEVNETDDKISLKFIIVVIAIVTIILGFVLYINI